MDSIVHNSKDYHYSVSRNFIQDQKLTRDARFLFVLLKSYANHETLAAFPSRELLCNKMNCTDRSLGRYLNELIQTGYVKKTKERKSDGTYERNIYSISEDFHHTKKTTSGKNEDLTIVPLTMMVNNTTNIYHYLNNVIDLAVNLLSNYEQSQITTIAKVINKFKRELGIEKLQKIILSLIIDAKKFESIDELASYLQQCTNNIKQPGTKKETILDWSK